MAGRDRGKMLRIKGSSILPFISNPNPDTIVPFCSSKVIQENACEVSAMIELNIFDFEDLRRRGHITTGPMNIDDTPFQLVIDCAIPNVLSLTLVLPEAAKRGVFLSYAAFTLAVPNVSVARKVEMMPERCTEFAYVEFKYTKNKGLCAVPLHCNVLFAFKKTHKEELSPQLRFPFADMAFCVLYGDGSDPNATALVYANRAYLAVHSEYFRSMFYHGFKEANQRIIQLMDVCENELEYCLDVIHPMEKEVTKESVGFLLALADRFIMPTVAEKCGKFLEKPDSGMPLNERISLADRYGLVKARMKCIRELLTHKGCLYTYEPFSKLEDHLKLEVLYALLPM